MKQITSKRALLQKASPKHHVAISRPVVAQIKVLILEPLLKETFSFFQKIHTENLIQFEEKEWILLQGFLDVEAEKQA